jgi:adenylate kinase family enzyme
LKEQLRAAEEMGEYIAAGKLRKKISQQEQEEKEGTNNDLMAPDATKSSDADRKLAVDIASKCIDQAFSYASDSLNAIGLPLTPRLAEYLRTRLKGAESDIAVELEEKWGHVIFDWKVGHSI